MVNYANDEMPKMLLLPAQEIFLSQAALAIFAKLQLEHELKAQKG